MYTSPLRILTLLLAVFFLGITACEKEPTTNTIPEELPNPTAAAQTTPVIARFASPTNPDVQQSNSGGLNIECIVLNFPFELVADGVTYPVSSTGDFDAFLNGPANSSTYINFVYPVYVTLDDGTTVSAADEVSLSMFISDCIPDTGWNPHSFPAFFFDDPECLTLAYPVTLLTLDSVRTNVVDANALVNLLTSSPDLYFFDFPLSTFDASGALVVLNDAQALLAALTTCATSGGHGGPHGGSTDDLFFILGGDCFTYNYPISLVSLDSQFSVANENEFVNALLSGEFEDFSYPVSVTLTGDGSTVTIGDETAFLNLFNQCGLIPTELEITLSYVVNYLELNGCLTLTYPVDVVVLSTGNTLTLNDGQDAQALFAAEEDALVVFPVNVNYDGQAMTVNSGLALEVLARNCVPNGGSLDGLPASAFIAGALDPNFDCYDMVFPFSIEEADGTRIVISDKQEAAAYFNGDTEGALVYPVQATPRQTGVNVDLNSAEDFFALIEDCI